MLTEQEYGKVLKETKSVVVQFLSPNCGHCKIMQKVVEKLESRYSESVNFYGIDILNSPQAAKEYEITALPSFLFLRNGEILEKLVGEKHELILEQAIQKILS